MGEKVSKFCTEFLHLLEANVEFIMWHNMVNFRNLRGEADCSGLSILKSVDEVLGTAIEKRVTVV